MSCTLLAGGDHLAIAAVTRVVHSSPGENIFPHELRVALSGYFLKNCAEHEVTGVAVLPLVARREPLSTEDRAGVFASE